MRCFSLVKKQGEKLKVKEAVFQQRNLNKCFLNSRNAVSMEEM